MTKPLFMWAGGKTRMIKHYLPYIPETIDTYVEPFFGGGAMFLHILKTRNPKTIIINDINPSIVAIYDAIKNDYLTFLITLNALESEYLPKSKEDRKTFFFEIRRQHAYEYEGWSKSKEAATLYFLMKTGFNGIFQINKNTNGRFGTPSGLLNQTDKVYDRSVLDYWNEALQKTDIRCGDWPQAICEDSPNAFLFFDPPYRGSFADYGQPFDDEKQLALLDYCKASSSSLFLCNRKTTPEDDFFSKHLEGSSLKILEIGATYTAGRRKQTKTDDGKTFAAKKATELLIYR